MSGRCVLALLRHGVCREVDGQNGLKKNENGLGKDQVQVEALIQKVDAQVRVKRNCKFDDLVVTDVLVHVHKDAKR